MKTICLHIVILSCFITCKGQQIKSEYIQTLDIVWNTINDNYFDKSFNGLDWEYEYSYYKPLISNCKSKDSLYYYLNQMLFKLNVSHLGVISPDEANEVGDPQLFLDGSLGLDLRLLNNEAIFISVNKNSPAFLANIKPGYQLLEVNRKSVEQFISEKEKNPTPPFNDRNKRSLITQNIIREFYGTPGDPVRLKYKDERENIIDTVCILKDRGLSRFSVIEEMPSMYATVSDRQISNTIGYIKIDAFLPQILDSALSAIDKYKDLPNLIIDLRGTPGGVFEVRRTIAEQFVSERTLFWRYHSRNEINEVYLNPPENPYTGKLVILTDELSASSSEEFAGGMKALGRATIIGQQTPGKVVTMEVISLPGGAFLVYPDQQTRTSKNDILEGKGVVPDLMVQLDKRSLLSGVDTQLERAISFLNNN